jgi:hypothetical protein
VVTVSTRIETIRPPVTFGEILPPRLSVFDSVIMVAFQIAFRAEIHANNIFLFFKNYF